MQKQMNSLNSLIVFGGNRHIDAPLPKGAEFHYKGLRPGEKRNEELLTIEERPFTKLFTRTKTGMQYFSLHPVWGETMNNMGVGSFYPNGYSSDMAREMTLAEFKAIVSET